MTTEKTQINAVIDKEVWMKMGVIAAATGKRKKELVELCLKHFVENYNQ
jgi:hypothetical protein